MQFFLFLALLLAIALMLFSLQNLQEIAVSFMAWKYEGSLAFILALTFIMGLLAGVFITIPTVWRKVRDKRVQKKRIQELEGQLSYLHEQTDKEGIET